MGSNVNRGFSDGKAKTKPKNDKHDNVGKTAGKSGSRPNAMQSKGDKL
jgi:hypothetical protein